MTNKDTEENRDDVEAFWIEMEQLYMELDELRFDDTQCSCDGDCWCDEDDDDEEF